MKYDARSGHHSVDLDGEAFSQATTIDKETDTEDKRKLRPLTERMKLAKRLRHVASGLRCMMVVWRDESFTDELVREFVPGCSDFRDIGPFLGLAIPSFVNPRATQLIEESPGRSVGETLDHDRALFPDVFDAMAHLLEGWRPPTMTDLAQYHEAWCQHDDLYGGYRDIFCVREAYKLFKMHAQALHGEAQRPNYRLVWDDFADITVNFRSL